MSTNVGSWLSNELDSVGLLLEDHLNSKHDAVNEICRYLSGYRGKMLRPSLVLLSWRSVQENTVVSEDVLRAAGVVELIHLATLVHDDVLDEADIRRGGQTINSLWGNEGAVMLGDYLLSSAFHLCSTIRNPDLNALLGEVTNTLCAGRAHALTGRVAAGAGHTALGSAVPGQSVASCASAGRASGRSWAALHRSAPLAGTAVCADGCCRVDQSAR